MAEKDALRVLGIEGTAWAASAAVFETPDPTAHHREEHVHVETEAYVPDSGGIHPREAAEHMSDAIPTVVESAIEHATERAAAAGESGPPIDAVAFSRGPGLGPCLRITGTAARAVAQRFEVPLVGVNHMVAHLEIGRHRSGFGDPVCLNASGANAHVLAFRNGRYRVLGETMDAGVGNALDKFTRHVGWSHPGGPKIEERARAGEYVDLPYVVKGMDFSFSGLSSAAQEAADEGVPIEDVCRGLEETAFAMLTEVSERALSLTGASELVLGGGVGQNERLRGMLSSMCEQRGADFFAPSGEYLRDNAGMIAVLGAKMCAAGDTLPIADSGIDADFRPDQVPVIWREPRRARAPGWADAPTVQGAEATVTVDDGRVTKTRNPRAYRHPALDERLRRQRTRSEARLTSDARRVGVPTPVLSDVDVRETTLVMGAVGDADLRDRLSESRVRAAARHLATLHDAGIVHGDPTVRNVRVDEERTFLIDFGLGYYSQDPEDHAMDLHVCAQSLEGTADDADALLAGAREEYVATATDADAVVERLRSIEGRGRYQ
jgi:N6-L-threonylcarbamoyladenine synthase/protein kinase Bud32